MEDVREKPMAVGRHGDQIDVAVDRCLDQLGRRVAHRERGVDAEPLRAQLGLKAIQIRPIRLHFLGLAQVQLIEMPSRPPVGNVNQQELGAGQSGELRHVIEDRLICVRVLDGDQDSPVHYVPTIICSSSQTFRSAIATATTHASARIHRGVTNGPILCGSLVNMTSGKTAKGNWRLSTTWLRMISGPVPRSPYAYTTAMAGMIATRRVISRRSHGRIRRLMNPSMTIWPASVPVSVAFCPEQRRATAKSALAMVVPRSGESS